MNAMLKDESANLRSGFHSMTVRRPIGLLVVFVTLIVIGVIAYVRIPITMLPTGMTGTRISVWVTHPGSSAQENEDKVARVLEEQFRTLPALESLYTRASDNSVSIRVAFNGHADMNLAKAELRDRIERARPQLPDTIDRINVWANDDGDPPVMFFALLVPERTAETDDIIENHLQRKLEGVEGVSRVQIWGMLNDSIRILLDEEAVKGARLDIGELVGRLSNDNFAQPLGDIDDGGRRFLLRSDMRFGSLEEVADYPIGDGMRLSDVARVERVKTVRDWLARIDGKTAYYGFVQKESAANVVAVSGRLQEAIADFDNDPVLAGKFGVEIFFDQARFIQNSLNQLKQTAMWGGGLAVLILFMFLRRVRTTLCVALSIPVSALLAVAWEAFTGGTFNVLTMTGLTLGIGMLVDNSVVVIENIARLRARGYSGHDAAVAGVRDVGLAIALATLTSVVVFLPLIFMSDNPEMRTILGALGIPLCSSLLFSLLVALVFLPVITARILGPRPAPVERVAQFLGPIAAAPVRLLAYVSAGVRALLFGCLVGLFRFNRALLALLTPLRWPLALGLLGLFAWRARSLPTLQDLGDRFESLGISRATPDSAAASIVMGGVLALIAAGLLIIGLPRWRARASLPPSRPTSFAPRGLSVLTWIQSGNRALLGWTLDHRLLATLFAVLAFASVQIPMGRMTIAAFGQDEDTSEIEIDVEMEDNFTLAETSDEMLKYEEFLEAYREPHGIEHIISRFGAGGGEVELRWAERMDPEKLIELRERLRKEMPRFAGHELRFSGEQQIDANSRQFVHFQLRGTNAAQLEELGKKAVPILKGVPGLLDVSSALERSPEQIRLVLDEETAFSYGVTADMALRNVAWALRGAQLPRFHESGREVPFIIEYDHERLAGLDTLRDLDIYTADGRVPLAAFTNIEFQPGRRQIRRYNGQTTFNIQARVEDPNRQGELVEAGYTALEGLDMPRGFTLGRDTSVLRRQQEEQAEMMKALALSIVLVFLLMGILFESLLLPFSVLTTIPFAVLGALWTLYVTGTTMDSVGWIGVIILVGVVVNNGIVLIDKIHRMRLAGHDRRTAVLDGAGARVRPIMMTALTTVFGLLPMALGDAPVQGIDYRALATCVAGGLAVSTFFTLWIVPLAYTVMDDLTHKLGWLLRRSTHIGSLPPEVAEQTV